jgi:hypothetical protein
MGSSADLYIRCSSDSELAEIRTRYPGVQMDVGALFAKAPVSHILRFTRQSVQAVADELCREVIYLSFSSVADSIQFTRCTPGRLHRHLQHGMYVEQSLWEEVEGDPEPWEAAAFFPATMIRGWDDPQDLDRKLRVEELYRRRFVVQGEDDHYIDGRESARAAAHFYGLSGWR